MKTKIINLLSFFIKKFTSGIVIFLGIVFAGFLFVYATSLTTVEDGQTLSAETLNGIINWINNEGANKTYVDNSITNVTKESLGIDRVDNTNDNEKNVLSATKLTNARSIGGVSFDGSANINLPGVNTIGNQSTTGNAASSTKLQTARTINGVSFNGSANITLPTINTTGNQTIGGVKTFSDNSIFNGNVGIGTSSPGVKLQVNNSGHTIIRIMPNSGANNRESLVDFWSTFDNHTDTGTRRAGRVQVGFNGGTWGTEYMAFGIGGASDTASPPIERMRISGNGNVGIGTATPSYKLHVNGTAAGTSWTTISDERYKKDIAPIKNALDKVQKLQGVYYNWKQEEYPDKEFSDKNNIGFIAQEVEKIIPELVTIDNEGYKGVEYANITAILVEAIKELKQENDNLKYRIDLLENK